MKLKYATFFDREKLDLFFRRLEIRRLGYYSAATQYFFELQQEISQATKRFFTGF